MLQYCSDRFIRSIAGSFPMFMTMSWIFGSAILVKSIVYEKEQRLKETMKVIIKPKQFEYFKKYKIFYSTIYPILQLLKAVNVFYRSWV